MIALESVSLAHEEGYMLLIHLIAMKIYDEKQRQKHGGYMQFYINDDEYFKDSLNDGKVQKFIKRMKELYKEAKA